MYENNKKSIPIIKMEFFNILVCLLTFRIGPHAGSCQYRKKEYKSERFSHGAMFYVYGMRWVIR